MRNLRRQIMMPRLVVLASDFSFDGKEFQDASLRLLRRQKAVPCRSLRAAVAASTPYARRKVGKRLTFSARTAFGRAKWKE